MEFKDRSRLLAIIGVPILLVGLANALLGPIEIYCFYLFSLGGPFYYEGFGFGSFMFGNIASQILGYYLLALLLIPLGYGHLRLRRWGRTLALTLLYAWLVLCVPLSLVFLFVLLASKDLPPLSAGVAVVLLGFSCFLLPGLLIRFYRSRNVRLSFESRDPGSHWIEGHPLPVLVLSFLLFFYAICLHILILFRGLFPLFGSWLSGGQGIVAIAIAVLCLGWLTWGVFRRQAWAWWGALFYMSLMAFSWIYTLARSSFAEILSILDFPPTEMEILQGLPFQGYHFAALIGLPLLLTLGCLALAKRHFDQPGPGLL